MLAISRVFRSRSSVKIFSNSGALGWIRQSIRSQRASFIQTFHPLKRKEERAFHGEGSAEEEILAESLAASFETAYEIRPTEACQGSLTDPTI